MSAQIESAVKQLVNAIQPTSDLAEQMRALDKKLDALISMIKPADEMLDAEQAAALLGYAHRTYADKVCKRTGFPKRYGKRWKKSEVLAWAAKQG